jgi:hypothetical protein
MDRLEEANFDPEFSERYEAVVREQFRKYVDGSMMSKSERS